MPKSLIVVAGPTAAGKSALAIRLAKHFDTEVVSADSRQVFAEMNIGTAKPLSEELSAVTHHFIGNVSIEEGYDAATYGEQALEVIGGILAKRDYAVLVGGSGLYIKAVVEGFDPMPEVPGEVRAHIVEKYRSDGLAWLQQQVKDRDPVYFETVDRQNPQRLMRALEILTVSGERPSELRKSTKRDLAFNVIKVGVAPERDTLNMRIDQRVDEMIAAGLFEEATALYPRRHLNALQTVGYQEIFGYLDGEYDKDEAIRLLKRNTRHYAKRQLTWFKRDIGIKWFSPAELDGIIEHIKANAVT